MSQPKNTSLAVDATPQSKPQPSRARDARREKAAVTTTSTVMITDLERRALRLPASVPTAYAPLDAAEANVACVRASRAGTSRADRVGRYIAREEATRAARAHAESDAAPNVLVLEGDRGAGTSSVLSAYVLELHERVQAMMEHEDTTGEKLSEKKPYVVHVTGGGPAAREFDFKHLLWMTCARMEKENGSKRSFVGMPQTADEAPRVFYEMIEEIALDQSRVVVVVIDELDEVDGLGHVKMSEWLPATMPSDIRVIIGVRTRGKATNYLSGGGEHAARIVKKRLSHLNAKEKRSLAHALFNDSSETIITGHIFENITSHKDAGLPEYLYLAAHELRRRVRNGQRRPDAPLNVDSELRYLPQTCEELVSAVFEDLQNVYGFETVRQCMILIESSRNGVTPAELADIAQLSKDMALALSDDISHMCWCYESGMTFDCVPKDALVLRSSYVIDYVRSAYCSTKSVVEKVQRDAALYFLRKVHASQQDFQSRDVLEVLHFMRNGSWIGSQEVLFGYMTDLHLIQFMWKGGYKSDLLRCWHALTVATDKSGRDAAQVLTGKLMNMNNRMADNLAEHASDFLMWIRAYPQVITMLEIVCNRPNSAHNFTVSLNTKYGRALRYMSDWSKSITALKLAYSFESSNFNGNTPAGASVRNELSLSLARTNMDKLTLDSHGFKGSRDEVKAAINEALESAKSSVASWKLCHEEESDGFKHLTSAMTNVAVLYGLSGDHAAEAKAHETLLADLEAKFGPDHRAIYVQTKHMASMYAKNKEWEKAELCVEQMLSYTVDVFPEDSLELLNNLLALADLYADKKDFANAAEIYDEVLGKLEAIVDDESEMLANACGKTAHAAHALGKDDAAKKMFIRALEITTKRYGKMYRGVARRMMDLAAFHADIKNNDQAKALYTRAMEIETHTLGNDHPDLAVIAIALAKAHKNSGNEKSAINFCRQAEQWLRSADQDDYPDLAKHLHALAVLYKDMNHFEKTEALYAQALTAAERDYFRQDDFFQYTLSLAELYKVQRRWQKARRYYEQALETADAKFGPKHLEIARRCVDLGETLLELQLFVEAKPLFIRARDIRQTVLGHNHLDTKACVDVIQVIMEHLDEGNVAKTELKREKTVDEVSTPAPAIAPAIAPAPETIEAQKKELSPAPESTSKSAKTAEAKHKSSAIDAVQRAIDKVAELAKREREDERRVAAERAVKAQPPKRPPAEEKKEKKEMRTRSSTSDETEKQAKVIKIEQNIKEIPTQSEEEQPTRAVTQPKTIAASVVEDDIGNLDGFLSEFVEYLGHRQYKFKLDGKVLTRFSLVRAHVEKNFRSECQRWSRGERIQLPAPEPVEVVVEKLLPLEPKSKVNLTRQLQAEPPALYAKSPIVESPQSENTAPFETAIKPVNGRQRQLDAIQQPNMNTPGAETPQSRAVMEHVQPSNEVATVSMKQYEYTVAKIDSLEKQLAEMREMMQRLLYERQFTVPHGYVPPDYARYGQGFIRGEGFAHGGAPQNSQYTLATGHTPPPPPPPTSQYPQETTHQRPTESDPINEIPTTRAGDRVAMMAAPASSTFSTAQANGINNGQNGGRRLFRFGGTDAAASNAPSTKPPLARMSLSPRTLKNKLTPSEMALDVFMKHSTDNVGHRRICCRLDGVTLSTPTLMRAHYERCHMADASAWFATVQG